MIKRRRVVEADEEDEVVETPISNGKIVIARTVSRNDVPAARSPGQRNPEYEKLVARLIKLESKEEGVCIAVESKKKKVQIREGVRKPLRVRGFDLTAVTDHDDELGEVLYLYATKRETEDVEVDEEDEEEPVAPRRRAKRKPVEDDDE